MAMTGAERVALHRRRQRNQALEPRVEEGIEFLRKCRIANLEVPSFLLDIIIADADALNP